MKEIISFMISFKKRLNFILNKDDEYNFHFVITSTNSDLDSLTAVVTYAFFQNIKSGFIKVDGNEISYDSEKLENNDPGKTKKEIFIPVINCDEDELFWRLDIADLMSKLGVNSSDFFFFDEVFDSNNKVVLFKELKSKLLISYM